MSLRRRQPPKQSIMATVKLKNIKKVYDKKVVAVHDFNLDIADKEFIVLVGPSGCGKSTTLRMIAGLEEISGGELYIEDELANDVPPKDRNIAMVFQNYALYPHMTVYKNMAFALALRKMDKDEIDERVRAAAKILGITELLQRKPKALSGGQRQRVAIGRAIVREPEVFLFDEPLSNLDAKLRNQMRAEIIKLRQRIDTTFIYVTHDQIEAMTLGDRIVIMKDGYIQQIGTPQEVFNNPRNLFVAGFIGMPRMNMFPARLVREGTGYVAETNEFRISLADEIVKKLRRKNVEEQEIVLGARPEHIRISLEPEEGAVHTTIDVIEMMGNEVHIHANVGGVDVIICAPTMGLPQELQHQAPDEKKKIWFCLYPSMLHLFSKETEENLLND